MASHETVARALAIMQELWSREITPELVRIYRAALADVDDDTLLAAVRRALASCKFFPVPAELRHLAGVGRPRLEPAPDVAELVRQIWGHAEDSPGYGQRPPRVELVRRVFGDSVAEAYGYVGPERLFASNETTWQIARRDFAEELRASMSARAERALPPMRPLLPAAPEPLRLVGGAS
jgi:hypothetical protein